MDLHEILSPSWTHAVHMHPICSEASSNVPQHKSPHSPRQDIFSLGCVIAEVFCDGKALFDLSQLLAYRR